MSTLGYVIGYVADVPATVAFYESAFGLTRRFVGPDGDYAEMETGATTLAFAGAALAATNLAGAGGYAPLDPAAAPPGVTITLLYEDVPAALATALAAGATPYVDAMEMPWGQTVAYVRDPDGILVELATPVHPVSDLG
jgi:catechol 2,3-dioxygenase-like lactoylglutathione lyase family enzyme